MRKEASFGDWLTDWVYSDLEATLTPEQAQYVRWCKKEMDRPKTTQEKIRMNHFLEQYGWEKLESKYEERRA